MSKGYYKVCHRFQASYDVLLISWAAEVCFRPIRAAHELGIVYVPQVWTYPLDRACPLLVFEGLDAAQTFIKQENKEGDRASLWECDIREPRHVPFLSASLKVAPFFWAAAQKEGVMAHRNLEFNFHWYIHVKAPEIPSGQVSVFSAPIGTRAVSAVKLTRELDLSFLSKDEA